MVVAERASVRIGAEFPRIAPPLPLLSKIEEYEAAALALGINLYPWQRINARYMTAVDDDGRWLYRELATIVARQNGKTETILPRIRMGLENGESILHTAQNRDIPRKTFVRQLVPAIEKSGLGYEIRKSNGQEEITSPAGGRYKIVAPNAAARGETADLVIIDEIREQRDYDLMDAMRFTTTARPHAQTIYLSNAGDLTSLVLNDLRKRGVEGTDPRLAYLEWSAAPNRALDDRDGWAEANPALGHGYVTEETIEAFYNSAPASSFETENLCRTTLSRFDAIVSSEAWGRQEFVKSVTPNRPSLGIKMDISAERASAVLAWQEPDDRIALEVVADVEGHPIDVDRLGPDLQKVAVQKRATLTAYDPVTDADLARHLRRTKALTGRDYANATEKFVRLVSARQLRVHDEAGIIGSDLAATIPRKSMGGAYVAVKASPDTTNTAAEAAIRAAWLASEPRPTGQARIY